MSAFPTEWKPKPWGRTRTLYLDAQIEITECEIRAGGFCSQHAHRHKNNEFRVIKGWLKVATDQNPRRDINIDSDDNEFLHDTMLTTIPAGIRHQFLAIEDTRLIETYTPAGDDPIDPDDIERFTTGGLRK